MSAITFPAAGGAKMCPVDTQMVELSLLLPSWQAEELEREAEERGLTAGRLLRQALREFMSRLQRQDRESCASWE